MPARATFLCARGGCTTRVAKPGLCEACRAAKHREIDARRGTATERGYDGRWRKARAAFLRRNPLCVHCEREELVVAATVVDHIIPHKGDSGLFWDELNWQPLCKRHHDIKTAREDGGFGRGEGGSNL